MPRGIDLMPAVLPDEQILEAPDERRQRTPPGSDGPYVVILYNCDCHSFEQVEKQLQKATGCSQEKAEAHAMEVHTTGRSVVFSGSDVECEKVANILRQIKLQVETDKIRVSDVLPQIITEIPGPRSRALAQDLRGVESPNITYVAPDFPIFWEEAHGCIVTDVDGNRFLDVTSAFGVASVGHSHPRVIAAIKHQAEKLIHGMGDVHPSAVKVRFCEQIAKFSPLPRSQVILGQNGGDAIEAALKTALLATGRPGILAFENGYHGLSYGALDVTARPDFRAPFQSQLGGFTRHLPYGCPLAQIEAHLKIHRPGAVLAEPIQGRGGIVVPPDGWLTGLHQLCSETATLLILDEIFTGWGRTGDWFACQHEGVVPDILCIGKAMGGGLPLSACVASAELMSVWGASTGEALHTSTFLGNPLACAAGLAALAILEEDNLPQRAAEIGTVFANGLRELQALFPEQIIEVRGRGLMLGIEMASPQLALSLVPAALRQGLILLPAGDGRVLEFVPPLIITEEQIVWCLEVMRKVIKETTD